MGRDSLDEAMGAPIRRISVTEYERMVQAGILDEDERVELLEGVLVTMSPQGNLHALLVERLTVAFFRALIDQYRIRPQLPVVPSEYSEPEPDLLISKLDQDPRIHPRQACLVIEVSDSSLRKDRELKQRIYACALIPEYWIVNVEERCIEVYREPDPAKGIYVWQQTFEEGSELIPANLPGPVINISSLFA